MSSPTTTEPPPLQLSAAPTAMMVLCFVVTGVWIAYVVKNKKISFHPILLYGDDWDTLGNSEYLSPKHFLLFRLIITLYCWATFLEVIIRWGFEMYAYFTVWNFTILLFYFTVATYYTARLCLKQSRIPIHAADEKLDDIDNDVDNDAGTEDTVSSPKFEHLTSMTEVELQKITSQLSTPNKYFRICVWIAMQSQLVMTLLVDITLWTLLFPSADKQTQSDLLRHDNFVTHLLNCVFIYADFLLNSTTVQNHTICYITFIPSLYVPFSWLFYDTNRMWAYWFMDPRFNFNGLWYVILFSMVLLFWVFVCYVNRLKTRKLWPLTLEYRRNRKSLQLALQKTIAIQQTSPHTENNDSKVEMSGMMRVDSDNPQPAITTAVR